MSLLSKLQNLQKFTLRNDLENPNNAQWSDLYEVGGQKYFQ